NCEEALYGGAAGGGKTEALLMWLAQGVSVPGYTVVAQPPGRTDRPVLSDLPDAATIDKVPAFFADGFQIDFYAESFNRKRGSACDPPEAVLFRAIDSLFVRIRHVCRAPFLRYDRQITWRLRYLNDDGTEL